MPEPYLLEIKGLSKCYTEADREHLIFRDLNIGIGKGQLLVLLGRSGSGKSTLLNLISGIDLPSAGEIVIDGTNLTRLSEKDRSIFRRQRIGFIFQSYNLIPTLSVWENLVLPLELNSVPRKVHPEIINPLLTDVGLAQRAGDFPDQLSGGEQQRVAIARALVHDPDIVLADEPTGNLDLETGRKILDRLDYCVSEAGKTLIMATHSNEVIGRADRILRIRDLSLSEVDPANATFTGSNDL